jgi:uncharacterized protein YigE (DUF2233 family)
MVRPWSPEAACLRENRRMKSRAVANLLLALLCAAAMRPATALDGREVEFDGRHYRVVDVDLARDRLELRWRDENGRAFGSIEALRAWAEARGRPLRFATNAGIYDRGHAPLGLHVEDGRTLRPLNTVRGDGRAGNFSMQPNGVFYVDHAGRAGVVTTARWRSQASDARIASQSGPMLVVDGAINAAFRPGSDSRKWRSGVCAPDPHHVRFAVSLEPVNFHAFARFFRDESGCRDALYLDGSISRIYFEGDGYSGAPSALTKPYVGMFAVTGNAPAVDGKP